MPPANWNVLCVDSEDRLTPARLVRLFHLAGCRVTALAQPQSYLYASRYVDERLATQPGATATLEILERHLDQRGHPYDWIVLTDDDLMLEAAKRAQEPWLRRFFPSDVSGDKPLALVSKDAFMRVMAANDVPIPPFEAARGADQALAASARIGYPVIVKPTLGWGGRGIIRADSPQELDRLPADPGDWLVQRYIPGRQGNAAALFQNGRPVWWISSFKLSLWPAPFGPSSCRHIVEFPPIQPILTKVGAALGMQGFAGFDWVLEDDGIPRIIEMNGRPIPLHISGGEADRTLVAVIRDRLAGRAPAPRRPLPEYKIRAFPNDLERLVKTRRWGELARWLVGLEGRTDAPWTDPPLMWRILKPILKKIFSIIGLRPSASVRS